MTFLAVGINYNTAPVSIRERLSFPAEMSVASAQMMASFVKLLLDLAQQQEIRENKKDEAAN